MSENVVRKVQHFTIGTKLSVPKCCELSDSFLPCKALSLQPLFCPVAARVAQVERHQQQEDGNINNASRSIRKITISGSREPPGDSGMGVNVENVNNNNSNITNILPRIIGLSCGNKPGSPFKDTDAPHGPQVSHIQPAEVCSPGVHQKQSDDGLSQRSALFSREMRQAEAWIKEKLQELRDACDVQDCRDTGHALHRDMKNFENTFIRISLMGEQLICRSNPGSDMVKKELSHLREQWKSLKQMADNHSKALAGMKNLHEFNRKVDMLEAWIKEKEKEEQSLEKHLEENSDKIHLTRRILDLKHDEQKYGILYEEINLLAVKLEQQGKAGGRNITIKRKQMNKMWLKAQTMLSRYHQHLQLSLEASSIYQQADNILIAMKHKKQSLYTSRDQDANGNQEIRDIASQIMMLDVTVSQLSNLHPALAARVTQKQNEVKDRWAALQKAVRSEESSSREKREPVRQPKQTHITAGTEAHGIGKEVKEQQNRRKGSVSLKSPESQRKPTSIEGKGGLMKSIRAQASGSDPSHADDVTSRHETGGERGQPLAEPKPAHGNSPLREQLQRFTVSADKTLAWLKESVAMAAEIGCTASPHELGMAKRCQATLAEEITSNKVRMEVVKKEGWSLVRAQHPGSSKIEEFLFQLEALWEELKRRHQKNVMALQEAERLNQVAMNVLRDLNSLEAWLQAVEHSMGQFLLAGDPESMSAAERESRMLEKAVSSRGLELHALQQKVDKLSCCHHVHAEQLAAHMQKVEQKYQTVHSALTQQCWELQDTRMLTEFLERVELEEGPALHDSLGQPFHRQLDTGTSLPQLLMGDIGNPVEVLREAVEMLNDTARERDRSLCQQQSIQKLLSQKSAVVLRINECLSRTSELGMDILAEEADMVTKCEPYRCSLESLRQRHCELEVDYRCLRQEVEEVELRAVHVQALCPDAVGAQVGAHASLQGWEDLGRCMVGNENHLKHFAQLQDFFRNYLELISWTEDTRAYIFSDSAIHFGKGNAELATTELDLQIEQKFGEFDDLAVAGQTLIEGGHHLTKMIRERTEELQSMLGWILVRWRAQKRSMANRQPPSEEDVIYSEAMVCTADQSGGKADNDGPDLQMVSPHNQQQGDDSYEVMKSISPTFCDNEASTPPLLVMKKPSRASLGSTINLIFSVLKTEDKQVEVPKPLADAEATGPIHRPTEPPASACKSFWRRCQGLLGNTFDSLKRRGKVSRLSAEEVSTYLHFKETEAVPLYESVIMPHLPNSEEKMSAPSSPPSSTLASSSSCHNVTFHSLPRGSTSGVGSLRRSQKRKRAVRQHPVQKIMEAESTASEQLAHNTNTWPLKVAMKKGKKVDSLASATDVQAYVGNPLVKDIDAECTGDFAPSLRETSLASSNSQHSTNHCQHLSLGSVSSVDLPMDFSLIPSIPEVITISPSDLHRSNVKHDTKSCISLTQRCTTLSTFKHTTPAHNGSKDPVQPKNNIYFKTRSPEGSSLVMSHNITDRVPSSAHTIHKQAVYQNMLQPLPLRSLPEDSLSKEDSRTPKYRESLHSSVTKQTDDPTPGTSGFISCVAPLSHGSENAHKLDGLLSPKAGSPTVVARKTPASESNTSSYSCISLPFCTETPSTLLSGLGVDTLSKRESTSATAWHAIRPDPQQFEEEEDELQSIWNQSKEYRQSICSDIMYQTQEENVASSPPAHPRGAPAQCKAVLYRKLTTASAPNITLVEFSMTPVSLPLGGKHKPVGLGGIVSLTDRRSWAAFSEKEPNATKLVAPVNETACDMLKLPCTEETQKYIYQYREEEEEDTACLKGQSVSCLSGDAGLQGDSCSACSDCSDQIPPSTSREQCNSMGRKRPEFPCMEGNLERKHRLQLGGKRAPCRTWKKFHTVLFHQTLCFYQDRKDTLKSTAFELPLNLAHAECTPVPEYSKKAHCFSLRLQDGSHYLFSAPSLFLMKKWILKIQNTLVLSEDHASTQLLGQQNPSHTASYLSKTNWPSRRDHAASLSGTVRDKEIVVLIRDGPHFPDVPHNKLEEDSQASSSDAGHFDTRYSRSLRLAMEHKLSQRSEVLKSTSSHSITRSPNSRHRSHSFTSAMYQKITPTSLSAGSPEGSTKHSVTMFMCDTLAQPKSPKKKPDVSQLFGRQPHQDIAPERSYASEARPRNKSVFSKFFGKRD